MADNRSNLFSRTERAYGRALLELAEPSGEVDAIADEMKQLRELVVAQPDIPRLLSSRSIALPTRLASVKKLFAGRVSDLTFKFLNVLVMRHRFKELPRIADAFVYLVNEKHGQVAAEATVAYELDGAATQRVAQKLGQMLSRQVLLTQRCDPSLIGGIKLRVGDEVYDASVATQLAIMRERLIERGRERARQAAAAW